MNPLISIVLCTYNGEQYIRQQLDSLLQQTYPHLEFIVCDDASTDGTAQLLREYAATDSRIRLQLQAQNVGHARNFAQATLLAAGEFIAFSDQDDVWLPEKITRLYQAIGHHSMAYSNSVLVNEQGTDLGKKLSDYRKLQSFVDSRSFVYQNAVSGHTMLVHRGLLATALPLPAEAFHDWWFAIQAANDKGGVYVDECLTLYRQHERTVTKNIVVKKSGSRTRERRFADYRKIRDWIQVFRDNPAEKHRDFFHRFYDLYTTKEKGAFSWPLFFFLLRYRRVLFKFSVKSPLSICLEIRKLARGERPE
jgi:glycosyltransferase involved in cell wall biosynthesis